VVNLFFLQMLGKICFRFSGGGGGGGGAEGGWRRRGGVAASAGGWLSRQCYLFWNLK
jgi:hypothetical protein